MDTASISTHEDTDAGGESEEYDGANDGRHDVEHQQHPRRAALTQTVRAHLTHRRRLTNTPARITQLLSGVRIGAVNNQAPFIKCTYRIDITDK